MPDLSQVPTEALLTELQKRFQHSVFSALTDQYTKHTWIKGDVLVLDAFTRILAEEMHHDCLSAIRGE
jgi:hypothetical protein